MTSVCRTFRKRAESSDSRRASRLSCLGTYDVHKGPKNPKLKWGGWVDFYYLAEAAMIVVVVMILCGSLLVKYTTGPRVLQDYSYLPRVTVLMSCFNEGEAVYQTINSIFRSDYPPDKLHVVAIDDHSKDDSWAWMQKAASRHGNITISRNVQNLGKPKSLLRALGMAEDGLVLNIDSDGDLDPQAVRELASCFADPLVGAVGGSVQVKNARKNWLTQMQAVQYNTAFQISKIGETFSGAVNCISGAIFMLRKSTYEEIAPTIRSRRWWGAEVKDGEDRFMTFLILMRGYKTIVNNKAKVYTNVPESMSHFFPQQVRWRRGVLRLFFWTLRPPRLATIFIKSSPLSLVKFCGVVLFVFMWPIFIFWLLITAGLQGLILHKISMMWIPIVVSGLAYFSARRVGDNIEVNPAAFVAMPFWMIIDLFFVSVLAICTFNSISWETRGK